MSELRKLKKGESSVKRMIVALLVLAATVVAGGPAEAKRPSTTTPSVGCLNGTVTWQPTSITSSQPLMPVAISFSDPDADHDTISVHVDVPTTNDPSCPFNIGNLPSTVTATDTSPATDTVQVQPTSCGKALVYTFPVTCHESDTGLSEQVSVQVTSH